MSAPIISIVVEGRITLARHPNCRKKEKKLDSTKYFEAASEPCPHPVEVDGDRDEYSFVP